ncbi:DUF397 domain-containing protein [Streptomyces sp. NPDC048324]
MSWRKSTYSDGNGGDCVGAADRIPGVIRVRDSKVQADPVLVVGAAA